MISICVPTRGRPEIFKRFSDSIFDTASNPDNVEIVSYHDNDDDSPYEYKGNHVKIFADRYRTKISGMINDCAKVAKGDIYMYANDDLVWYTKGWDEIVQKTFDESDDKIIYVFPNDQWYRSSWAQCGWVHKNWIDAVGYFMPPYFSSMYWDGWINDIGEQVNRMVFLREVVVKHLVVQDDKVHEEYLVKCKEDKNKELLNLPEMVEERRNDAQKLQKFINDFNNRA